MDYSLESYRLVIKRALSSGYVFLPFARDNRGKAGTIYLRHDVDYSLSLGLELAKVNAELKVSGTFFVLLRSHAYNLLSNSSRTIVRKIHELGQHVALHAVIDADTPEGPAGFEQRLTSDFQFALREFPFLSPVFSWHNPTQGIIEQTASLAEIGGLTNAYSNYFTREAIYRSDSNMRGSVASFLDLVSSRQAQPLQLLFHPLIWVIGGDRMTAVLAQAWRYLISEQEQEMRENNLYREVFPEGMPQAVLTKFTESILSEIGDEERLP
jgi:hypothetical protein